MDFQGSEYKELLANLDRARQEYERTNDYMDFSAAQDAFTNAVLRVPFANLLSDVEISIDIGWYPIIAEACGDITNVIDATPGLRVDVVQIKEKFGGLRFYMDINGASEETIEVIHKIADWAENEASRTCEVCGEPGSVHSPKGWWKTVCQKHKS